MKPYNIYVFYYWCDFSCNRYNYCRSNPFKFLVKLNHSDMRMNSKMIKTGILLLGILLILISYPIYSRDSCDCNKSTWFWNDEIKEKKQFIRDFIENSDSLIYPEFYAKYKSFRIRNGFIEDNKDFFTGIGYNNLQSFYSKLSSKKYEIIKGGKGFPKPLGDNIAEKYRKKHVTAFCHEMGVEFEEIKYRRGDLITGNEEEDYGFYHPIIFFTWYCKNGEWILTEIMTGISDEIYTPTKNSYFEDW